MGGSEQGLDLPGGRGIRFADGQCRYKRPGHSGRSLPLLNKPQWHAPPPETTAERKDLWKFYLRKNGTNILGAHAPSRVVFAALAEDFRLPSQDFCEWHEEVRPNCEEFTAPMRFQAEDGRRE